MALLHLLNGTFVSQAISVAARLGVADALAYGSRSVAELAEMLGAHAPSLYRLLRGLTDTGVVTELAGGKFALTPFGEPLRSGVPGSLRAAATMVGMPFHRNAWTELYESVRTGESAFARTHGSTLFDYLAEHPEEAAIFDGAMTASAVAYAEVWEVYDFARFTRVVDVGGGKGQILGPILAANPHLEGVLFDTPDVVADAGPILSEAGVTERCWVAAGSFFDTVPTEGDAYLLTNVIHDWDDDSAAQILSACRRAMTEDATILLVEGMLSEQLDGDLSRLVDLNLMAVTPGGRLRTEEEYAALLERAGLQLTRVLSAGPASIIEAVPASGV